MLDCHRGRGGGTGESDNLTMRRAVCLHHSMRAGSVQVEHETLFPSSITSLVECCYPINPVPYSHLLLLYPWPSNTTDVPYQRTRITACPTQCILSGLGLKLATKASPL